MTNNKKRVLVLGSTGTLGVSFRNNWSGDFDCVFAVRIRGESPDIWFDIALVDDEMAVEILKSFDYVVNCAAITNVDKIESDLATQNEAWKVNAGCVKKLAEWCREANTTLIHISTDFVFNGNSFRPYIEDDKTNPVNVYGTTKEAGEDFIRESGCRYYIVRTSWVYSEQGNNCFTRIIENIITGRLLQATDDIISSPTYAKDLVGFICELISKKPAYGIYHFTNEGVCTRYDFVTEIIHKLDDSLYIVIEPVRNDIFNCPAKRPYCSVLSKEKARNVCGKIKHWRESLCDCIAKFSEQKHE